VRVDQFPQSLAGSEVDLEQPALIGQRDQRPGTVGRRIDVARGVGEDRSSTEISPTVSPSGLKTRMTSA
jgi:hypothetical protein